MIKFGPKFSFNFSKRVLSPNLNVFDDFSCFFVPVGNEDRASSVGEDDAGKFGDMLAVAQVRKNKNISHFC